MKNKIILIGALAGLLTSCGNSVEEIKDPLTGKLTKRYEYYKDGSGQVVYDGEYTEWYKNGNIRLHQNYKNGKRSGESIFYQSKDSIYFNNFDNDQRNSVCRLENAAGVVLGTYIYKNDKLSGITTYCFPNGEKYLEATYMLGFPSGEWKYFDEKGKNVGKLTASGGLPNELLGRWNLEGSRLTSFEFRKDGTMSLFEPFNKYATEPFESMIGKFEFGRQLTFYLGRDEIPFDIVSVQPKIVVLKGANSGEIFTLTK